MCCTRLAGNAGGKNRQKFAIWAHNFVGYIFASKARIDNRKNLLNSNISPTCPHNMVNFVPTNGLDLLASLGHPSKFQRVSRLGFVTALTLLNGGQPNFARCLAVSWSWTSTLYIHFRGCCPITEFCQVQNSLCVQVLRSPVLTALLHGTRAFCVSKSLRGRTSNGITELSQRAHQYSAGRPSRWASAHVVVSAWFAIWNLDHKVEINFTWLDLTCKVVHEPVSIILAKILLRK